MKRIFILAAFMAASVSCTKPVEFSHGIGFMSECNVLSADGGKTSVPVFSNTDWTLGFNVPVTWAGLDRVSGHGNGDVKFNYKVNYGRSRAVVIEGRAGGETASLKMFQKAGISDDKVIISFADKEMVLAAGERNCTPEFTTNLVYQVDEFETSVDYPDGTSGGWIGDIVIIHEDGDASGSLSISLSANSTGVSRTAYVTISHTDAGSSYNSEKGTLWTSVPLTIVQSNE